MVAESTLDKAKEAQHHILTARRLLEDLRDVEQGEWLPGHGPKPRRMVELEITIRTLNSANKNLDSLWS